MSRLPSITGKQVIAALKKLGLRKFASEAATTTYDIYLRHPDGRVPVVAAHAGETVGPGLLSKILRDTKVSKAQLSKKLWKIGPAAIRFERGSLRSVSHGGSGNQGKPGCHVFGKGLRPLAPSWTFLRDEFSDLSIKNLRI